MPADVSIRLFKSSDFEQWLQLRACLWPDLLDNAHAQDQGRAWLLREDAAVLVLEKNGTLEGFVEEGERPYADGCDTSPVAFLEGWFVREPLRGLGWGAALVREAENWARSRGRKEFASDALLEDTASQKAHRAVGFEEVERAVRYRKPLLFKAEVNLA